MNHKKQILIKSITDYSFETVVSPPGPSGYFYYLFFYYETAVRNCTNETPRF